MSEMLKHGLHMVEEDEANAEVMQVYDTVKRAFQTPST